MQQPQQSETGPSAKRSSLWGGLVGMGESTVSGVLATCLPVQLVTVAL
jgi:hypothetical protein